MTLVGGGVRMEKVSDMIVGHSSPCQKMSNTLLHAESKEEVVILSHELVDGRRIPG